MLGRFNHFIWLNRPDSGLKSSFWTKKSFGKSAIEFIFELIFIFKESGMHGPSSTIHNADTAGPSYVFILIRMYFHPQCFNKENPLIILKKDVFDVRDIQ